MGERRVPKSICLTGRLESLCSTPPNTWRVRWECRTSVWRHFVPCFTTCAGALRERNRSAVSTFVSLKFCNFVIVEENLEFQPYLGKWPAVFHSACTVSRSRSFSGCLTKRVSDRRRECLVHCSSVCLIHRDIILD